MPSYLLLLLDVLGVGRGVTGRRLSFGTAGRVLEFFPSALFALARGGAVFEFSVVAFALRLALAGRFAFALTFALPFALSFSFAFLFLLRFGRFSLAVVFTLRFSLDSSAGFTVSGVSPCFAGRLMSRATVCPVLTTSPGRGN